MGKLSLLITFLFSQAAFSSAPADYSGFWWNEDRSGIFELVVSEQSIEGITRWGKEPQTDSQNPDPALRSRSLKDITFLWGFEYQPQNNSWQDGRVYDPDNGKTYSAKMHLDTNDNTLEMRGYIGISLFGRSARFERVKEQDLPAELDSKSR
tara:strand:- start:2515 stop:2970 length:456 start_codon:yes stop_codon:yes gene_type:complete